MRKGLPLKRAELRELLARRDALLEADELAAVQVALEQAEAALRAELRRLLGSEPGVAGSQDASGGSAPQRGGPWRDG